MGNKIIYIKFGELSLKGKNKMNFINSLFNSVRQKLNSISNIKILKKYDCFEITSIDSFNQTDINKIINELKTIPGIGLIIKAFCVNKDLNDLKENLLKEINSLNNFDTFKIITKRLDKTFETSSMDVSKIIGGYILEQIKNSKVDLHNPNFKIFIEIKKDKIVFYFEKSKGLGGFPIGINGKCLMLISGGIDSPVAAKLLLRKGMKVDFLTFVSPPHTSEKVLDKVEDLIKIITDNGSFYTPKFYVVNFTKLQHEISHIEDKSYQITLMRRYFFRIAEALKEKHEYDSIATGESLGQVASQTIESINTISSVLKNTQVLRPLLTYDKSEIIELSKKFNTYNISILPYADSCSLFVPKRPVTKPTAHKALNQEQKLEFIDDLLKSTIQSIEMRKLFNKK